MPGRRAAQSGHPRAAGMVAAASDLLSQAGGGEAGLCTGHTAHPRCRGPPGASAAPRSEDVSWGDRRAGKECECPRRRDGEAELGRRQRLPGCAPHTLGG